MLDQQFESFGFAELKLIGEMPRTIKPPMPLI